MKEDKSSLHGQMLVLRLHLGTLDHSIDGLESFSNQQSILVDGLMMSLTELMEVQSVMQQDITRIRSIVDSLTKEENV